MIGGRVYGVPSDSDLHQFAGSTLVQVCLGEFDLQLHFRPAGEWQIGAPGLEISVYAGWELVDANGGRLDYAQLNSERESYRIHRLIGLVVAAVQVDAPRSITLVFSDGARLTVFDDDPDHGTFSIQPGDVFV